MLHLVNWTPWYLSALSNTFFINFLPFPSLQGFNKKMCMITLGNTAFRVVFSPCKQITSVAFLVPCVLRGRRPADTVSVPQHDTVVLQWLYFWCCGVWFLLIFRKPHLAQIIGQEADAMSWSSLCRRHNNLYQELHILSVYFLFFFSSKIKI